MQRDDVSVETHEIKLIKGHEGLSIAKRDRFVYHGYSYFRGRVGKVDWIRFASKSMPRKGCVPKKVPTVRNRRALMCKLQVGLVVVFRECSIQFSNKSAAPPDHKVNSP